MVEVQLVVPEVLGAILARLDKVQTEAVGRQAALKLAPKMTRWLIDNSQFIAGSGPFSRGWLAQPSDGSPGLAISNNSPKSRFIEFPTKAHIIRPRPGTHTVTRTSKLGKTFSYQAPNVLAWVPGRGAFSAVNASGAKAGAKWIFAMEVHHPGTGGKGVFPIVLKNHTEDILNALGDAALAILSGKPAVE